MTGLRLTVALILLFLGLGLIIFDIFLATNSTKGDTISELVGFYSLKSLLLPAFAGILAGHFWWYNTYFDAPWWAVIGIFSMLGLLWLVMDIHMILIAKERIIASGVLGFLRKYPIINFSIHVIIGHLLWGQSFIDRLPKG